MPVRSIPLWENVRRCRVLEEFRNDVISYFSNGSPLGMGEDRRDEDEAVQVRRRINHTVDQAHRIIVAAGLAPMVMLTPSPMIGGYAQPIDVILNLFELHDCQISEKRAVDLIERALGVYQSDRTSALRRTINPFWWLFRVLLWFVRIPFVFLGAVGFDVVRAEGSTLGNIFKLLIATSALLTILNLLGWLSAAKVLLSIK